MLYPNLIYLELPVVPFRLWSNIRNVGHKPGKIGI